MRQKDLNSLSAIHGGGCKEVAIIASVAAGLAAVTLNLPLMTFAVVVTNINYLNCR